jgi:hypothetical protein
MLWKSTTHEKKKIETVRLLQAADPVPSGSSRPIAAIQCCFFSTKLTDNRRKRLRVHAMLHKAEQHADTLSIQTALKNLGDLEHH